MNSHTLVRWAWLHKWSSLICTIFMLLLFVTGLPLIFSHEIHHLSGNEITPPAMTGEDDETTRVSLEAVVQAATGHKPGLVPLYFFAEEDEPDIWLVKLDTRVDTDEKQAEFVAVDARTAAVLGTPVFDEGMMHVLYRLHVDMFLDLPGKLFLGLMGFLLLVSIVSGVVLYGPFMRKLAFGTVRRTRSRRIFWLDQHNLLGIVTLVWVLVVGATGVINTWADLILRTWQAEQIMLLRNGQAHTLLPPVTDEAIIGDEKKTGVDLAIKRALEAVPGMQVATVAFPGTLLSTPTHFAVFMQGNTPLTARLHQAMLVDRASGEVLQGEARPWYVTLLQLSQPLHFGDYGGLVLKIIWALLGGMTIVVLGSGVYLWVVRAHHKSNGKS